MGWKRFIDNWAHAHRLSRAVFMVVALAGLLAWALWTRPPAMVSRVSEQGRVITAVENGATEIEMANGRTVRVIALRPVARVGDRIPMFVETYADGSTRVFVDHHGRRMRLQ